MSEITEQVGSQIREARRAKGLTLKEVGERMGVAEATVSRYEKGGQNLTVETLHKIAEALGLEFGVFFR